MKLMHSIFLCVHLSMCVFDTIVIGTTVSKNNENESYNETNSEEDSELRKSEVLFKALFRHKRAEHIEAVKTIINFGNYEKQYKMVSLLLKKMFEVMSTNKLIVENSDYIPGSMFPGNESVKEALSQVLENTAFFGELMLKLPDVTHALMNRHRDWQLLIIWCIGFSNSTGLYDKKTEELINLLAQEMNLVEKDPSFINPYKTQNLKVPVFNEEEKKNGKKKKQKPRGPKMSRSKHAEL